MIHAIDANSYLVVSVLVMSFFQPRKTRICAMFYAVVLALSSSLSSSIEGYQYFLFCGIADVLAIYALCCFIKPSRLCDVLISLSILSFIVNASGAIAWHMYISLDSYYLAHTAIYSVALLSLLPEGHVYDSSRGLLSWMFRAIGFPGYSLRRALRKKAEV